MTKGASGYLVMTEDRISMPISTASVQNQSTWMQLQGKDGTDLNEMTQD